ncbi:MAG TPA: DUF6631 family protein [Pseudomonas sp.]|nr:DUF6631 family protein [Pseudomonas sp.]
MAKRVAKPAPEAGADDLEVLHPERSAIIAGRALTVREYGFVEGLGLRALMRPFLDDLHAIVDGGSLPPLDQVTDMLGQHSDAVVQAIAVAADVEPAWIHTLGQDDGEHLMLLWWTANGPFYVRSVYQRIATARAVASQHAGATSTPP